MNTSLEFVAGRGTAFVIDGPEVVISVEAQPAVRIPFVDLLEFALKHPLTADKEVSALP